ncbi:MAG: hypothetical protein NZ805_02340 [Armatimonadetes bacterium]|nr:hypothetical protein [Armatimonadota bacterium]MDW8027060.1 hypothetical protein [Armatimonadota bacterium]
MDWEQFRERVRSELGEALFTRPEETLLFVMKSWQELFPEKFEKPLRLDEADETPADFAAVTQQFLWQVLDNSSDTAAVLLWLTLAEWLSGWLAAQSKE